MRCAHGSYAKRPIRGAYVDYTWSYQGKPQAGSFLVGFHAKANAVSAYWIDTWHMGHLGMECRGTLDKAGGASLRGSYAAPPDPDWGWRTEIIPDGIRSLRVTMHNISPDGRKEIAVEAEYTR